MQPIRPSQLTLVCGGEDYTSLTSWYRHPPTFEDRHGKGTPPGQPYVENDHSGPSDAERAVDNVDRALAPWEWFNSMFGWRSGGPKPRRKAP